MIAAARAGVDLMAHRRSFPALAEGVYANFGARGVMSQSAIQAVVEMLGTLQAVGPGSRLATALIWREVEALREAIGRLVNVAANRVALVENVSQACAAAIWGVAWRPGDQALIGPGEPPGTWLAVRQAAARFGFEPTGLELPDGASWRARVADALRPSTRLVLVSHVDWTTGRALPLGELVRLVRASAAHDAAIVVDGAQAAGALPVDLSGLDIDAYALTGQKWLGGPDGVAALVLPAADRPRLAPSFVGWRAAVPTEDGADIASAPDARRFETGAAAYALMPGLREAMRVAEDFAPAGWRTARIAALTSRLAAGLKELGGRCGLHCAPAGQSGIVSIGFSRLTPAEVVRALERRGIVAKAMTYPPEVRFCVHYLTLESEVDAIIAAVAEVAVA